jgi:hypothetical protein
LNFPINNEKINYSKKELIFLFVLLPVHCDGHHVHERCCNVAVKEKREKSEKNKLKINDQIKL